ncbi:MAG TPA: hypothetical protein DCP69_01495 [Candidatus Omnitrophica bacterium]|nr:hypothetical protein [Candidatus Omnitrophota bacterium]
MGSSRDNGAHSLKPLIGSPVRDPLPKGVTGLPPIAGSVAADAGPASFTFGDPRLPARFWAKVRVLENGCWEWTATRRTGYGRFKVGSRRDRTARFLQAHRFAYETLVGPIPEGLESDHLCRNRPCIFPAHIEPVTPRENVLRGDGPSARAARQTHCLRGHPLNEINTCRLPSGKRECRPCRRLRQNARNIAIASSQAGYISNRRTPLPERVLPCLPGGDGPRGSGAGSTHGRSPFSLSAPAPLLSHRKKMAPAC